MSSSNLQFTFQQPSIAEYYSGKTIALTGGTGFVGHCVIEKLLRCCPDVRKIFVLMRKKRDRSPEERLERLLKMQIFDTLRNTQPKFAEKVVPVYSNLEEDNLGLDDSSIETIQNEVNVFIHSAATLRFDEPLKVACKLNTLAVRSMLQLCRGIQNLEAVIHVSTAYSYCDRKKIGEKIYQTGWDFDKLNDAMQWMTDDMIEKLTPDILRDRPNTYTLTKAFGEEILAKDGEGLPICIVRPSIIGGAEYEPVPGWCTNLNGLTGMLIAASKGLLHIFPTPPDTNVDIIPVDYVVNGVIAAGWKTGLSQQGPKMLPGSPTADNQSFSKVDTIARSLNCAPEADSAKVMMRRKTIPIYNITVGEKNVTTKQWADYGNEVFSSHPNDSVFKKPSVQVIGNKRVYRFLSFVQEYLPAYLIDALLKMFRQKPMMLKYNKKISDNIGVVIPFIDKEWTWKETSLLNLHSEMSKEDKKTFNLMTDNINWRQYIRDYIVGSKLFIAKETPKDYELAEKRRFRLKIISYIVQATTVMALWRFVVSKLEITSKLWHLLLSFLYKFVDFFQLSSALQKSNFLRF